MIRRRILLGVLLAVLFALGWWAGRGRAAGGLYANLDLFVEVLHAVRTSYVDEVETGPLVEGGLRGMLRGLDPASEYLDPKAWSAQRATPAGELEGVGVFVDSQDGWPVVIAPLEGSPAWQAGLVAGDVITRVDGRSTWGLGPPELAARMRGPAGSPVTLSVVRGEESRERDVVVKRVRVEVPAVRNVLVAPGGVGYLRLAAFNERAATQVRAALDTLRRAGARSLVVDLRGNAGGLAEQAVSVAASFLPAGSLVATTQGRGPENARRLVASKGVTRLSWPMAVLVDGGTAAAAEILVGALQDRDRALVVGTNTFGEGSVQSLFPLRGGEGGVRLTTARYHTPSGRSVHRRTAAPSEDEAEDEDGATPPQEAAPDTVAADSAARPVFRTAGGRIVRGGGGIAPDVEARADSLPPARSVEAARAALAHDPAFQRAAEALRRAKDAAGVFAAVAPAPAPARPARASRPPRPPSHGARSPR